MALEPITAGIGLVSTFIDKFVKDKDLAVTLKHEADSQEFAGVVSLALGQMEVNKAEAAHKSLLVAGWRPFIGWVCGVGLLYNVLIQPIFDIWFTMPEINPDLLYPVLLGMLGMSGLRTYEKFKGVQREE
jgi:hypothetical protein|tara:strand:- start:1053 stop:1442 length:390 start_codon:yes stop_codon:yes gene_type:complete